MSRTLRHGRLVARPVSACLLFIYCAALQRAALRLQRLKLLQQICGCADTESCKGCDGVPNSGVIRDPNGVCGGSGWCDGVANSGKRIDRYDGQHHVATHIYSALKQILSYAERR